MESGENISRKLRDVAIGEIVTRLFHRITPTREEDAQRAEGESHEADGDHDDVVDAHLATTRKAIGDGRHDREGRENCHGGDKLNHEPRPVLLIMRPPLRAKPLASCAPKDGSPPPHEGAGQQETLRSEPNRQHQLAERDGLAGR